MAWATSAEDISAWARVALQVSEDALPDADTSLTLLRKSATRKFFESYPALATAWASLLDNVPTADQEAVAEAIGWKVGAVLTRLPRSEETQIVKSIKVGQLAESYQVQDPQALGDLFDQFAAEAVSGITSVTGIGASAGYAEGSPLPGSGSFFKGRPVADDTGTVFSDLFVIESLIGD